MIAIKQLIVFIGVFLAFSPLTNAGPKKSPIIPEKFVIFQTEKEKVTIGKKTRPYITDVYTLSDVGRVEEILSRNLPGNEEKAAEIAIQRLQNVPEELMTRLQRGYAGILMAKNTGITKVPAAAFVYQGETYVIYGRYQSDVALREFQHYMKKKMLSVGKSRDM